MGPHIRHTAQEGDAFCLLEMNVLWCRRSLCFLGPRTSISVKSEFKSWTFAALHFLLSDNDPKHTSKVVAKWLKNNKVKVLEWPSQSPDLNPTENVWAELKMRVRARRPTNLTQIHQLCREEWAKMYPTYCGKLVKGYPKHLIQVKPFKGNATKY